MVKKRGEVYYLRLHVPKDIQGAVGCKEFVKTLGTGRTKEAKGIAHGIKVATRTLWQQVRLMQQKLSSDEIKAMVKQWFDKELQQYADPAMAPRWLTDHIPEAFEFFLDELSDRTIRLKHLANFPKNPYVSKETPPGSFTKPEGFDFIEHLCNEGAPSEGSELQICQEIVNDLLQKHNIQQIDDDSEFYLMRHIALAMAKVTETQRHAALNIVSPEAVQRVYPIQATQGESNKEVLLSEAMQLRLEEISLKRANTTVIKFQGQIPILLKILGDKPVSQYKRSDFISAHKILNKWPRNANLVAPNDSVEAILKRTDLGVPLAEQTVFAYLTLMSTVFNFCVVSDWIPKSPVPKWSKPAQIECNDTIPFTNEQLAKIFSSPHFTIPARRIKEPHNFWVPIIALYTGMRMDEICQLYLKDIVEKDGTLCFQVVEGDDQKTKNHRSRYVPVHPVLMTLGLLEYVEKLKADNQKRFFPMLDLGIRGYSTNFGKNINKYLLRHVTKGLKKEERPTFHSLRKNFSQAITAQGTPYDILATLLGHVSGHKITVEHYAGKYPPSVLRSAVEGIDFSCVHRLL